MVRIRKFNFKTRNVNTTAHSCAQTCFLCTNLFVFKSFFFSYFFSRLTNKKRRIKFKPNGKLENFIRYSVPQTNAKLVNWYLPNTKTESILSWTMLPNPWNPTTRRLFTRPISFSWVLNIPIIIIWFFFPKQSKSARKFNHKLIHLRKNAL